VGIVLTERNTLKELAEIWLDSRFPQAGASNNEYNTYQMYKNVIDLHINTSDAALEQASNLRTDDLQKIINSIVKRGHHRTASITRNTLVQIFRLGVEWNKLLFNPADKISLKKYKAPEKRTTTELEEKAILRADLSKKERAFLYLELFAGLRKAESLALLFRGNKKDIDLEHGTISINKTLIFKKNEGVIKLTPKTDSSNRINPIISPLRDALIDFIENSTHTSDYLFETQAGALTTRSSYRKMWESIIKKLNEAAGTEDDTGSITDLTSHILRHTFATYLAVIGVNPQTVQRLLGHSSIQMTMDVYTHLPLYHRYNDSPIVHYYRDFLISQKSVKTIKRKIRVISKNKKKPLV
ncbi:site-specific integrase, partial [Christensenella minuta]|uniref:tyrosine-type recombinase/integrase n=1 Tax=Christensenella minuta TaxID=626937 RepID=UPI002A804AAF